jgi:hypothetical protein
LQPLPLVSVQSALGSSFLTMRQSWTVSWPKMQELTSGSSHFVGKLDGIHDRFGRIAMVSPGSPHTVTGKS